MDKGQTAVVLAMFKTAYPTFGRDVPPDDAVNLWALMLADCSPEDANVAARRYIAANKFPPTIADIRAAVIEATTPTIDAGAVWQEAQRLFGSGIAPDDEREALSRMSQACRAGTIATGGWLTLSTDDSAYTRRAFIQGVQTFATAERERSTLPPSTKANVRQIGGDERG